MITIHLTGYLKDLVPNPQIKVEANSVAEAVTALQQFDAFNPRKSRKRHIVEVEGFSSIDAINDKTDVEEIFLIPVIGGSKQGGLGQIILGIIMIIVAIYFPEALPSMMSAGSVALAGGMMVLGGLLQMLAPQPKLQGMNAVGSEERSKYLGANANTVAIGTNIPIIYGRRKWAGHYVSFDVDSAPLNGAPAEWYSSPYTNNGELTYSAAPEELPMPEPWEYDNQPEATFLGMIEAPLGDFSQKTQISFSPSVQLDYGQYDLTFINGTTLNVFNEAPGLVSAVTVPGDLPSGLPPVGTQIIFTRNYA